MNEVFRHFQINGDSRGITKNVTAVNVACQKLAQIVPPDELPKFSVMEIHENAVIFAHSELKLHVKSPPIPLCISITVWKDSCRMVIKTSPKIFNLDDVGEAKKYLAELFAEIKAAMERAEEGCEVDSKEA